MDYLNPKIDLIFEKIFGSQQNKDVLISFLDALLFESQKKIEDIEIVDSRQVPVIRGIEDPFLCVKAVIAGHKTIIEMQVVNLWGHERLSFCEAADAGIIQLNRSPKHTKFKSVIALTIADVEVFYDTSEVISWYSLAENEEFAGCSEDTDLVFVELTKFTKSLEQLITLTDRWIYFIKRARNLKAIPEDWQDNPVFNKAFQAAEANDLSREELDLFIRKQMYVDAGHSAVRKGIEEGLAKREGRQIAEEIAYALLDVLDVETISQKTGLSVDEISALR